MATTIEELQVLITAKTSGLRKEIGKVKNQMHSAQKSTESVTKAITQQSNATSSYKNRLAQLTSTLENTNAKMEIQKAKLVDLKEAGEGVNESAILQMQKLEQESFNLEEQIRNVTDQIAKLKESQSDVYGEFHSDVITDEIKQLESELSNLISKADETGFKMADLQQKMDLDVKRHQEKIINTEGTILRLQKTIDSTNNSINKIQNQMQGTSNAIEETRKEINKVSKSVNNMSNQFTRAFKRIAKQVLVFAVLYKAIRELQKFMSSSLRTNEELRASLNNLRANLLIAFQPIYDSILPALISLVQWLARATQYVAAFISGLFGKTYSESMKAAQGLQTARKALDNYGKSAKKTAGLAGFDELNLIGGESAGEVDAGGVDFGALADEQDIGALDRISQAMQRVTEKVKDMARNVKTYYGQISSYIQEHSDIIVAALAGVGVALGLAFGVAKWGSIIAMVQRVGAVIGATLAAINWPITLIVAGVAALVGGFTYFYRTNEKFRNTVQNILSKIGEVAVWLWENVMKPFGAWLATAFVVSLRVVGIVAEWLWKNVLVPFGEFLKWLWENVLVPVGNILVDVLGVAFQFVSDIAKEFWQKVLVPLGKALNEMFRPAVEAVSSVLKFLWEKVLKPFASFLSGTLKVALKGIISALEFLWKNVLKPLTTFVGGTFKVTFSNVFDGIGTIIKGLKTTLIGLMDFITGVFTGDWEKAWNGVKDIFKGVFDSLWGIVKTPLNMIIDGVNSMIGGLNKISINAPDWVPGMGGKSFGINIPKIPKLDIGTNKVLSDGLAMIHKGESIVPARVEGGGYSGSSFDREMLTVLRDILGAIREGKIAEVVLSERDITNTAIRGINREARRTGRNPLTVV